MVSDTQRSRLYGGRIAPFVNSELISRILGILALEVYATLVKLAEFLAVEKLK